MDADAFLILYRDEEENLLRTDYAVVDGAPSDPSAVRSASFVDEDRSAADEVLRTGRPLHVPGGPSDTDASALLVPMQVAGETTGVIEVHSRRVGGYTDGHVELLAGMANVAAIAMRNARLIERIARGAEKLRSTLSGTINALSMASETRDPYTAGHQRRVTELASAIGEALELPAEKMDGLRMAGLLHDIGKMAVPAEILVKPSRLTETEFELLQAHPTVGFNILKSAEMPQQVAEIVLQHHERLDGSGYPHGIRGDEIMLEARILAVADVVEAMSSHRPYRPALGLEAALKEIETQMGSQFDPSVVEVCVALCREGAFTFSQENAV
jgi:putative nucleotidyltransferase with HDIG domain